MTRCEWCGTTLTGSAWAQHTKDHCREYLKAALSAANEAAAKAADEERDRIVDWMQNEFGFQSLNVVVVAIANNEHRANGDGT